MHGEVVIYKIKPDALLRFRKCREQLIKEYQNSCKGLVAANFARSCKNTDVMVDIWEWASVEAANSARAAFQSLPSASAFMDCVESVIWSSQVQPVVDED